MKDTYLDFSVDLAKKAGKIMKANFGLGMEKEWKSDDTPLTKSDTEINQMVIDAVEKEYPSYSIIAEEGSRIKNSEYAWVCDPIDGTVPFSHGYPIFVFALALVKNGEPIMGVMYDPFMDRLLVGEKGKGARLNNAQVHVSSATSFKDAIIDIESWNTSLFEISGIHPRLIKEVCMTSTIRSAYYAGLLVSCGEFGAVLMTGQNPWDGAIFKIIVEEAGGKVTDLFGNDQRYDEEIKGVIVSNGLLHDKLIALVKPFLN